MFGVGGKCSVNADKGGGGVAAPVITSTQDVSVCDAIGSGFQDSMTLSGDPIDESLTEYNYTHFQSGGGFSREPFPGPNWTAYTQNASDADLDWDVLGAENGPLNQPTAAGPYIGADPWTQFDFPVLDGGGGANWFRIEITVKNAGGQDTAAIFWQSDCF